jgi:hypothetical protein
MPLVMKTSRDALLKAVNELREKASAMSDEDRQQLEQSARVYMSNSRGEKVSCRR